MFVSLRRNQSESRMREIRTSGLMSGAGKRDGLRRSAPAPGLDSTAGFRLDIIRRFLGVALRKLFRTWRIGKRWTSLDVKLL